MINNFAYFDFENMPDFEPLENTLSLLRNNPNDDTALSKLLGMDTLDLDSHCQWPELISLLCKSLLFYSTENKSFPLKVMEIHVRFMIELNQMQALDIAINTCQYIWTLLSVKGHDIILQETIISTLADCQHLAQFRLMIFLFNSIPSLISHARSEKSTDALLSSCLIFLANSVNFQMSDAENASMTSDGFISIPVLLALALVDDTYLVIHDTRIPKPWQHYHRKDSFISSIADNGGVFHSALLSHATRSGLFDCIQNYLANISKKIQEILNNIKGDGQALSPDYSWIYLKQWKYILRLWFSFASIFVNKVATIRFLLAIPDASSPRWDGRLETQVSWDREAPWGPLLVQDEMSNKAFWHLSSTGHDTSTHVSIHSMVLGDPDKRSMDPHSVSAMDSFLLDIANRLLEVASEKKMRSLLRWSDVSYIVSKCLYLTADRISARHKVLLIGLSVAGLEVAAATESNSSNEIPSCYVAMGLLDTLNCISIDFGYVNGDAGNRDALQCWVAIIKIATDMPPSTDRTEYEELICLSCIRLLETASDLALFDLTESAVEIARSILDERTVDENSEKSPEVLQLMSLILTQRSLCKYMTPDLCLRAGSALFEAYAVGGGESSGVHAGALSPYPEALLNLFLLFDSGVGCGKFADGPSTDSSQSLNWSGLLLDSKGVMQYKDVLRVQLTNASGWEEVGDALGTGTTPLNWLLLLPMGLAFAGLTHISLQLLDLADYASDENLDTAVSLWMQMLEGLQSLEGDVSTRKPLNYSGTLEEPILQRLVYSSLWNLTNIIRLSCISGGQPWSSSEGTPEGVGLGESLDYVIGRRLSRLGTPGELALPLVFPLSEIELDLAIGIMRASQQAEVMEAVSPTTQVVIVSEVNLWDEVKSVNGLVRSFRSYLPSRSSPITVDEPNVSEKHRECVRKIERILLEYARVSGFTEVHTHAVSEQGYRSLERLQRFGLSVALDGAFWLSMISSLLIGETRVSSLHQVTVSVVEDATLALLSTWKGGLAARTLRLYSIPPVVVVHAILNQWFVNWLPLTDILLITAKCLLEGHAHAVQATAALVIRTTDMIREDSSSGVVGVEALQRATILIGDTKLSGLHALLKEFILL